MPAPLGPISAAQSSRNSSMVSQREQRLARIPHGEIGGPQHGVAAAPVGAQVHGQIGWTPLRTRDGADAARRFLHPHHAHAAHARLAPALAHRPLQTQDRDGLQLATQSLELALGDAGVLPGDVAADILDLLLQPLLLRLVDLLAPLPALLPLPHIGGVVAPVLLHAAPAHLPDAVGHRVQEVAVVADHQQGALPAPQGALQPLHRLDVQVVGRLVQDQQVGRFQQQTRQQRPRLLAAAQVPQRHLPLRPREAQTLQHLGDAHLVVVAALPLEALLRRAVARQQGLVVVGGHLRFHRPQRRRVRLHRGEHGQHLGIDRMVARREGLDRLLPQIAQTAAAGDLHAAARRRGQPHQDLQQRGLADPIRPHQADPPIVRNDEREPAEDVGAAKGLAEIGYGEHRSAATSNTTVRYVSFSIRSSCTIRRR